MNPASLRCRKADLINKTHKQLLEECSDWGSIKWERRGKDTRQDQMTGKKSKYTLPVVEEDIWDPYQIGRKTQVLNAGVALWVP